MKLTTKAALIGTGLMVAYGAQAALLNTQTRNTNFTFAESAASTTIPLNDAGALVTSFNTTANNQKIVVSYTAECSVYDDKNDTWLNLDILVDGVAIRPSNSTTSDALCSSDATGGYGWRMNAMNAVYVVPTAGAHTVQLTARLISGNGGATGWLGDTSLIVWR